MTDFKRYMRVSKSSEDKEIHLKKLASVINTPHWREVLEEIEDCLLKRYEWYDECKTYEEFMVVQGHIKGLKSIVNLNGLIKIVAARRLRIRPTD
tara:strand:- start:430 stop:714 length:285 start_codon:yes stop_codon:yes gene_type:complete